MTTTLTIGADDWGVLNITPAQGAQFSFWPAKPILGADGRVLSTDGWTVTLDASGNATTVIPDAVAGNGLVIAPTLPGLTQVTVAAYPTGTLTLVQLLAYVVDPTTLAPAAAPDAWWEALGAYVRTVNGIAPDTHGDVEVAGGGGGGGAVASVNGHTGAVVLGAPDVGAYALPGSGIPKTDMAAAVQTSLGKADAAVPSSALGANSGVATLDSSGKLLAGQLPAIAITDYLGAVANQAAMLALVGQKGDWATRTDLGTNWLITGTDPTQLSGWTQLTYPGSPVTMVNGRTGAVTTGSSDITDSTAVGRSVITAADAATARTALGAGTSSLALGTSSTTAKRGDYAPASTDISDSTAAGRTVLTAASTSAILDALQAVYGQKAVTTLASLVPGWWAHLQLNLPTLAGSTDPESFFVESMRGGTLHRAFWLNESGSPRGASIASEPAMKLFGPEGDHSYTGEVLSLYNWWTGSGSQVHLWGVNMAGNPVVGSGATIGSNVVLLGLAAAVPTGLPAGTIIVRKTV